MKIKTKNVISNTITSLPPSPDQDRHRRMINYSLAMGIRLVCFVACFFVHGWWIFVPAAAVVVLPYIAVVLANVGHEGLRGTVERPGTVDIYRPPAFEAGPAGVSDPAPEQPVYTSPATGSNGEPRPDQR
jgi:hypothetical protein